MHSFSVSVIVPIYNEEEAVVDAVQSNIRVLQSGVTDFEIILVNDGSGDNSLHLIQTAFNKFPFIKICTYEKNGGFGKAVRTGIALSGKEYIICVPVDSPLNDAVLNAFLESMGNEDIIVSYRRKRIGYNLRMRVNSYIYHLLISRVFNISLKDYNWIHCYHRKIFDENRFKLKANGIFLLAEVLVQAQRHGYTIAEIPVDQELRLTGIATASKLSAIINTLKEMIVFRFG